MLEAAMSNTALVLNVEELSAELVDVLDKIESLEAVGLDAEAAYAVALAMEERINYWESKISQ
jgi:hypothetical protein